MTIQEWEKEQILKQNHKVYGQGKKNYKDPRREKLLWWRTHYYKKDQYMRFDKEPQYIRKMYYRQYRRKIKQYVNHEKYEHIYPIKRTSGWLYW